MTTPPETVEDAERLFRRALELAEMDLIAKTIVAHIEDARASGFCLAALETLFRDGERRAAQAITTHMLAVLEAPGPTRTISGTLVAVDAADRTLTIQDAQGETLTVDIASLELPPEDAVPNSTITLRVADTAEPLPEAIEVIDDASTPPLFPPSEYSLDAKRVAIRAVLIAAQHPADAGLSWSLVESEVRPPVIWREAAAAVSTGSIGPPDAPHGDQFLARAARNVDATSVGHVVKLLGRIRPDDLARDVSALVRVCRVAADAGAEPLLSLEKLFVRRRTQLKKTSVFSELLSDDASLWQFRLAGALQPALVAKQLAETAKTLVTEINTAPTDASKSQLHAALRGLTYIARHTPQSVKARVTRLPWTQQDAVGAGLLLRVRVACKAQNSNLDPTFVETAARGSDTGVLAALRLLRECNPTEIVVRAALAGIASRSMVRLSPSLPRHLAGAIATNAAVVDPIDQLGEVAANSGSTARAVAAEMGIEPPKLFDELVSLVSRTPLKDRDSLTRRLGYLAGWRTVGVYAQRISRLVIALLNSAKTPEAFVAVAAGAASAFRNPRNVANIGDVRRAGWKGLKAFGKQLDEAEREALEEAAKILRWEVAGRPNYVTRALHGP